MIEADRELVGSEGEALDEAQRRVGEALLGLDELCGTLLEQGIGTREAGPRSERLKRRRTCG